VTADNETAYPVGQGASPDYPDVLRRFDQAILAYKAQAIPLLEAQDHAWKSTDDLEALSPERPFTALRVLCDRRFDDAQVQRLAGCLGYALQATLNGPELSAPTAARIEPPTGSGVRAAFTLVEFAYDARLSGRTAPDYSEAFARAREYVRVGTPVRTTNKAGSGTQGTRLVEGLGTVNLSFYVR